MVDEDVEAILLEVYPAKVLLDEKQIGEVPAGLAALLRFLGRGAPHGEASFAALAEHVERMTARFFAAIRDEGQWSFGKRMWSTAIGEGVDLSDQTALDGWIRQFNERPIAERDQILGRMPAIPSDIGPPPRSSRAGRATDRRGTGRAGGRDGAGSAADEARCLRRLRHDRDRPRQPEAGRRQGL